MLWVLVMVLAFQPGRGQSIAFNHLMVEDGLSHNSVLAITQDKQGFMWYGTRYGLNRYDGQRFKVYLRQPGDSTSLPENHVMFLHTDGEGTLWVGTVHGLARYVPEKDAFEHIPLYPAYPARQPGIIHIYTDRKKRLWVATSFGLYLRNGRGFRVLRQADGLAGDIVRCIYEDTRGNIWAGTTNGLSKLTESGGAFTITNYRHEPGNANSLPANYINTIAEDRGGHLWLGMQSAGICLYNPVAHTFTPLAPPVIVNNYVRRIIADKAGKMWIGTQEGLSIMDPALMKGATYQHDPGNKKSLSQSSIHSLFEDNNGSVWIGTYFGGVNMINSYGTAFTTLQNAPFKPGLSNNVVSGIQEDRQHNFWIGTEGGGLNYYNRQTGRFTWYRHRPEDAGSIGSNLVKVILEDKDGHIWAGTHGGGLNLLQPNGTFKRFLYQPQDASSFVLEVTALLEDSQGRFWVGTNKDLYLMRRSGQLLTETAKDTSVRNIPERSVRYLYEDTRRRVLIGTTSGLYACENGRYREILKGYVNSMFEDHAGNIWVGMYYGGLVKLDAELAHPALYTEKNGLPSSNILGLLQDDGQQLWISTDNGLVKFNPAQQTFQTYTTADGIAGNNFNYNSFLKDSRGEFFFGGFNGITSFFPRNIINNTYTSPMVFTGLRLFNRPVGILGEDGLLRQAIGHSHALRFRHNQEVFTLEFALLNYIGSNKNRYAYRLEGLDRDWVETRTPEVTYTNLAPGSYTFQVKGANNDGIWSQPVRMEITVLPPFWRTWWAYCIYALLVAAIIFLVARYFFLQALLRKEEDLHQVKLNFFTNVSHEIRTHLTLLMAPVEKMLHGLPAGSAQRQPLQQVRNNAERLLQLVSELMDFRKAETDHLALHVQQHNLIPFLQHIHDSFREQSLGRHISTTFRYDIPEAPAWFDQAQLDKVFFNLLSNAFKFTPDGGQVLLHLQRGRGGYIITVTDNGRGIAPEYLHKLFTNFFQVADHGRQNTGYGIGLALSRHIVELHHGTVAVESEPPGPGKEGRTSFTVTLPEGKRHFAGGPHVVEEGGAAEGTGAAVRKEEVVAIADEGVPPPRALPAADKAATGIGEPVAGHQKNVAAPAREPAPGHHGSSSGEPAPARFTLHIVEDNPELRQLIRGTFGPQYNVLESENGAEGLALAKEQIPDLVISDVMMPQMDGLQFCHALKTDERTSHIPVILLTAKSSQADHVSGLETGADLYLTKPFSTRVLELNVRNLLALREKMREKFSRQWQAGQPPAAPDAIPNSVDTAFLEKVMQLVDEHMDNPEFGVDMLARKVAMSQPVLYKKLKAVTGLSVNDFVKSLRLKKAAELIRTRRHTVYEVAYMVGYNDRKYFSREFKKQFGKTPSEFAAAPEL